MDFKFEVHGDKLIQRKILRVGERATDLSPAFEVTVRQMRAMEVRLFDSQGASAARRWPDVTPLTLQRKLAQGLDRRTLHATLRLRRSLTQAGDSDQVVIITPSSMAFGTSVPYARRHQRGDPRRRPLDFSERDKRQIIKGLQRYTLTGQLEVLA
jgi:hypothetical protein